MEPPPAPTERMSTHGICNGIPTTSPSLRTLGSSVDEQTGVEARAAHIRGDREASRARCIARLGTSTAPATGPDMIVSNGRRRASPNATLPPEDVVIKHSPSKFSACRPYSQPL